MIPGSATPPMMLRGGRAHRWSLALRAVAATATVAALAFLLVRPGGLLQHAVAAAHDRADRQQQQAWGQGRSTAAARGGGSSGATAPPLLSESLHLLSLAKHEVGPPGDQACKWRAGVGVGVFGGSLSIPKGQARWRGLLQVCRAGRRHRVARAPPCGGACVCCGSRPDAAVRGRGQGRGCGPRSGMRPSHPPHPAPPHPTPLRCWRVLRWCGSARRPRSPAGACCCCSTAAATGQSTSGPSRRAAPRA